MMVQREEEDEGGHKEESKRNHSLSFLHTVFTIKGARVVH